MLKKAEGKVWLKTKERREEGDRNGMEETGKEEGPKGEGEKEEGKKRREKVAVLNRRMMKNFGRGQMLLGKKIKWTLGSS